MAASSVRQLRARTGQAFRPEAPSSNDTLTDPLGIGATGRGMYDASTGNWPLLGPLPDPRWMGFFQTLKENNARIGGVEGLPRVGSSGTAGDELADVANSMSGQPGSLEALRATATAPAKKPAATAPQAPPAPPAPPRPGTAPQQLDPTLNAPRYQAGQMPPGSLAALRRSLYGGE